ncbi:MAG: hypothetical protein QOD08_375 [Gaiellaceae bacterium]|jgi:hypothetical protein|nr:hypothetical protein [Gaiellaceae bacterium]
MTEARLRTLRLVLAGLLAASALASTLKSYPESWRFLHREHVQFSGYTAQDRLEAAAYANGIPIDAFNFFRAQLRRDDRYFVNAPASASFTPGVDRSATLQTFGRYYLLPAIAVTTPAQATVVLSVGTDPKSLGLPFSDVVRDGSNPFWVARVAQ